MSQSRRRALSVRVQLTAWFSVVFAMLVLLFGIVFYVQLRASLISSFDDALRQRTQQIAAGVDKDKGSIKIYDVTGELPGLPNYSGTPGEGPSDPDAQGQRGPHVNALGTLVRVIDSSGKAIYITPGFRALNVPQESISQGLHGHEWQGTVTTRDGRQVGLYSQSLQSGGLVYGILQVGEPLGTLQATLNSVVIELLWITPFVLLLGALGSYWLAARAFAPIDSLTGTARSIGVGDLHQRVPVPGANDEIRRLALTFNEMIERLERAFARQRRFVADASHELRTPVAAIRSMTDVALEQGGTAEEYRQILREVNAESERLGTLIGDLLALARADEGQVVFEREPVRLDLLAADVAATLEPLAQEAGIALEVLLCGEAITVCGDEARLIQVILNLLDNALTYTDQGGRVTLSVQQKQSTEGRVACLTVRDSGIGIPAEHLPHIFERFYRADPARSSASGGNGLGLAIVDWVVRVHGGAVAVTSQPGRGSTFTVTLPLVE